MTGPERKTRPEWTLLQGPPGLAHLRRSFEHFPPAPCGLLEPAYSIVAHFPFPFENIDYFLTGRSITARIPFVPAMPRTGHLHLTI